MDFEKPKTDHLVLKPRVIEPTDKPAGPGDGSRISVQKIHAENVQADLQRTVGERGAISPPEPQVNPEIPKGFKLTEFEVHNEVARPEDEDAVAVDGILLENSIAEQKSGWGRIMDWRRRKSRRGRDFIIVVGGFDLGVLLLMRTMPDVVSTIFGVGAITLFTSMVGWVMFMVVDPY